MTFFAMMCFVFFVGGLLINLRHFKASISYYAMAFTWSTFFCARFKNLDVVCWYVIGVLVGCCINIFLKKKLNSGNESKY